LSAASSLTLKAELCFFFRVTSLTRQKWTGSEPMPIIAWLLGVPLSLVIVLWLLGVF
jgi:hypothetical protein